MFNRTPLAWKNLIHRPRRAIVAIGGVTFAIFLMFMELGFLTALLDSTVLLIRCLKGDLFLVSPAKFALVVPERFPKQRLFQARACGVEATALCMESAHAILRRSGSKGYPIRVLAMELSRPPLEASTLDSTVLRAIQLPYSAAFDASSKSRYGFPAADAVPYTEMELSGRPIHLRGRFRLCTDFATDGTLIMSIDNFLRYFPWRVSGSGNLPDEVDIGILKTPPNTDLSTVRDCLIRSLPRDVVVLTKDEFIAREQAFWLRNTPIGYIFVVGTIIGFVVGVIICYQIVHADVDDHIREFATLAAMGYSHRYFVLIVICQSFYLSIIGFVPALGITLLGYRLVGEATGLMMVLRFRLAVVVFASAVLMCLLSGLLAVWRLRRADPASLF